jgi:hypothetical protein
MVEGGTGSFQEEALSYMCKVNISTKLLHTTMQQIQFMKTNQFMYHTLIKMA